MIEYNAKAKLTMHMNAEGQLNRPKVVCPLTILALTTKRFSRITIYYGVLF